MGPLQILGETLASSRCFSNWCLSALLGAALPLQSALPLDFAIPAKSASPARSTLPAKPWRTLENRKASISKIEIEIGNVFDLKNPNENVMIGRLANRFHAPTREAVIRKVLLFVEGERVRERRIYETERLLRALPFVKSARIDPVVQPDGSVVARVRVQDAWTTQLNATYQSVGGQKSMGLGVDEKNFMGMGKSVAFDYSKDHERTAWGLTYGDPQLFGSRWTLATHIQYLSDGYQRSFNLERPFFALDTPWSTNLALSQRRASFSIYDRGQEVYRAPLVQNEIRLGVSKALYESEERVWRGGLLLKKQGTNYGLITEINPPELLPPPALFDRRLRGPAITLSTQKDAWESFEDLRGMDIQEDYNLAWTGDLEFGTYTKALGSSVTSPFFRIQAGRGWSSSSDELLLLAAAWEGRKPATGLEDSHLALSATGYHKLAANQILAGFAAVDLACRPDPERWYYIGGDQGMRGYPNQIHPGDARWILSLDYRLLTDQRYWGLVRLGYSVFADLGSVRRLDGLGWSRTYSDVGVGLRLGNLKSSMSRVILISVAVPLTREAYQARWQFTIGNALRF
jgi:hypothetical protein